jgi:hypothetical protein
MEGCNTNFFMDEFRFYSRELNGYEIESEVANSGGGIEPSYVQVGCTRCELL